MIGKRLAHYEIRARSAKVAWAKSTGLATRWIAGCETSASGLPTGYAIYDLQERSLRRLGLTSGSEGAAGWLPDSRHLVLRGADGVVIYDTVAGTTRTILAECSRVRGVLGLARAGDVLILQRELLDSEIWLLDFDLGTRGSPSKSK